MRATHITLVALLLTGCSTLGYQSATVSQSRDALWKRNGDFKALMGYVEGYGTAKCEIGVIPPELCQRGRVALDAVKAHIAAEEAAALAKHETVDPAVLQKLLPLLLQAATTIGLRLPGVGL